MASDIWRKIHSIRESRFTNLVVFLSWLNDVSIFLRVKWHTNISSLRIFKAISTESTLSNKSCRNEKSCAWLSCSNYIGTSKLLAEVSNITVVAYNTSSLFYSRRNSTSIINALWTTSFTLRIQSTSVSSHDQTCQGGWWWEIWRAFNVLCLKSKFSGCKTCSG